MISWRTSPQPYKSQQ